MISFTTPPSNTHFLDEKPEARVPFFLNAHTFVPSEDRNLFFPWQAHSGSTPPYWASWLGLFLHYDLWVPVPSHIQKVREEADQ